MTTVAPRPVHELDHPAGTPTGTGRKGSFIWKMLTTTDHKQLGLMYITACFVFFFIGGLMALFIRAELALPGMQFQIGRASCRERV